MLAGNGAGGWVKGTSDKIGPNVSAADLMVYSKDFSGDGKPDIIYRSSVDKNLYLLIIRYYPCLMLLPCLTLGVQVLKQE